MRIKDIRVNDVIELHNGKIGRIVYSEERLPLGMQWAILCGHNKARVPIQIYTNSIVKIRRSGEDWVNIEKEYIDNEQ